MADSEREGAFQRSVPAGTHRGAATDHAARQGGCGDGCGGRIREAGRQGSSTQKSGAVFPPVSVEGRRSLLGAGPRYGTRRRPMSGFLLDTNCISELVRSKPEPRVLEWTEAADESLLYLSVLTLGEIRKGVAALPQGKRRSQLEGWLELDLQARFSGRILSIDSAIADRWGMLSADAKRRGRPLSVIDGLLAATALHHNLTIVSRNVVDFEGTQTAVLNPWKA